MDDRTGQIKEFDSPADALQEGYNVMLPHKPNPDCKRCGGTGSRKSEVTGRFVPCRSCYENRKHDNEEQALEKLKSLM